MCAPVLEGGFGSPGRCRLISSFLLNPALQDVLTGDEIISDSFDLKEVDNIVYEADCSMITEGAVDIGM